MKFSVDTRGAVSLARISDFEVIVWGKDLEAKKPQPTVLKNRND